MQITDVRLRKVNSENRMKAVASITFDNEFAVHDIKVIESQNGLFIAMPSRKTPNGEFKDIAHPINPETRVSTGELFMTFKLLKRRYRSTEESDKLRRMDYFNQPFEANSEIRLIDDLELPKPLGLTSLATQFTQVEEEKALNGKTKKDKEKEKKKSSVFDDASADDFEPFNFDKSMNY